MMMIDGNLVIGGTMIEEITVERSSGGGGGGGSGMGGFAFADGGSSHNSDLLRKGGRDAQWIDFKGTLNVAMALLNFRLGRSLPKGKGTNGGRPTIDNKTSDAIDAVNYGADAIKEVLKNNPNATTMDVQNVSPVAPPEVSIEIIVKNYHIYLDTQTIDSIDVTRKFFGTEDKINTKMDSTINNSRIQRRTATNWFNN